MVPTRGLPTDRSTRGTNPGTGTTFDPPPHTGTKPKSAQTCPRLEPDHPFFLQLDPLLESSFASSLLHHLPLPFQFGLALNTVRDQNQWAMLPDVSAACIMTPDTCGGAGATLTVWLKVTECDDDDGVLSSGTNGPVSTGLRIACGGENATLI